jgi:translation initiation factor 1A
MTRGVRKSSDVNNVSNRELEFMEEGVTEYAWVTKGLGNCRFHVVTMGKEEKIAKVRGNMRRRDWVTVGDLVLVSTRDFDERKVDIIVKYADAEVRKLKRAGENIVDFDAMRGKFATETDDGFEDAVAFEEDINMDYV